MNLVKPALRLLLSAPVKEPKAMLYEKRVRSFLCCNIKFTPWCHNIASVSHSLPIPTSITSPKMLINYDILIA